MKKLLILAMVMVASFLMIQDAHATLLGASLNLPDIFSDTVGTYAYNASTHLMSFTAQANTISFDGLHTVPITGGSYSAKFLVDDNSGNFLGTAPGTDLTISGSFTYNGTPYSGTLLTGEVTDFGWATMPGTEYAYFDYYFNVTGGALSSLYGKVGGDVASSERSNLLAKGWDENHSGIKVKHDTAGLPEPSSMLLLGMGILGLFGIGRKKIKA